MRMTQSRLVQHIWLHLKKQPAKFVMCENIIVFVRGKYYFFIGHDSDHFLDPTQTMPGQIFFSKLKINAPISSRFPSRNDPLFCRYGLSRATFEAAPSTTHILNIFPRDKVQIFMWKPAIEGKTAVNKKQQGRRGGYRFCYGFDSRSNDRLLRNFVGHGL